MLTYKCVLLIEVQSVGILVSVLHKMYSYGLINVFDRILHTGESRKGNLLDKNVTLDLFIISITL